MNGYIYLIRDRRTQYVKIGFSKNPKRRLAQLKHESTLLPEPLDFQMMDAFKGSYAEEQKLHRIFANRRVRGEWFNLCFWRFMDICYAFDGRARFAGFEWQQCDDINNPFSVLTNNEFCPCDECSVVEGNA